jgi:hypothetical protein
VNFAPAEHGLYFLEKSSASQSAFLVKRLDLATHEIRTIGVVPGPVGDEISVSPDEQWMLFYRADRQDSELMLVENFY